MKINFNKQKLWWNGFSISIYKIWKKDIIWNGRYPTYRFIGGGFLWNRVGWHWDRHGGLFIYFGFFYLFQNIFKNRDISNNRIQFKKFGPLIIVVK